MEKTVEDKERLAAEYVFLTKNYQDLKASLDSRSSNRLAQFGKLKDETNVLEVKLAGQTNQMKQIKSESAKLQQKTGFSAEVNQMQETIDNLRRYSDKMKEEGRRDERERSKDNLQRLSDECDILLRRKQKKINTLRTALRTANVRRRRLERNADRDRLQA